MSTAYVLSQDVGKKAACEALAVPRATYYRHMSCDVSQEQKSRPVPVLALTKQ